MKQLMTVLWMAYFAAAFASARVVVPQLPPSPYDDTEISTNVALNVNAARLEFYWNLGKDISEKYATTQYYGSRFFECVSKNLTDSIRNPQGLSVVNIRYCQRFYDLYSSLPNLPQLVEELVSVPWGQHRQRKSAPQKERSMDASTLSIDAGPIAAVVDSLLCGLDGKIVARLEEIASGFWAMSSTGRALGVACVI